MTRLHKISKKREILRSSQVEIVAQKDTIFHTHLVLGGARSGKSAYAESLVMDSARATGKRKIYLATAEAFNEEMQERIDLHIQQRGNSWHTIQEPVDITKALSSLSSEDVVLIDCLTIWVNNLMHYGHDHHKAITSLCDWLATPTCEAVIVSNEIGLGLVPMDKISREFRDICGTLNQAVAKQAKQVSFVAAGLPLSLKNEA